MPPPWRRSHGIVRGDASRGVRSYESVRGAASLGVRSHVIFRDAASLGVRSHMIGRGAASLGARSHMVGLVGGRGTHSWRVRGDVFARREGNLLPVESAGRHVIAYRSCMIVRGAASLEVRSHVIGRGATSLGVRSHVIISVPPPWG